MYVWGWWSIMICNSIINIYIWTNKRNKLAFFYVFTNAYRSTFPVMHRTNTCLFTGCSPFLERSFSNIAELAFIIQLNNWFKISNYYKKRIFIVMNLAEICCWTGIITGNPKWNVIEESLWCCYGTFILLWAIISPKYKIQLYKKFVSCSVIFCYIIFMLTYDIPLYINKNPIQKNTILICENISTDISLWYQSLIWMTGYFCFGSWVSLIIS